MHGVDVADDVDLVAPPLKRIANAACVANRITTRRDIPIGRVANDKHYALAQLAPRICAARARQKRNYRYRQSRPE